MNKVQHLYDYLVKSKLVAEESLNVYADEGKTKGSQIISNDQTIIMRDEYQINIFITDYPADKQDVRKLKITILWWINVYQGQSAAEDLKWEADLKNSSTSDLWFGILVDETTRMQNGEITTCIKQIPIINPDLAELPVFLRDDITGEEIDISGNDE